LKDKESASRLCSSSFDLIAQILLCELLGLDLHGLKEKKISSQERKEGNLPDGLSAAAD
jgi:hypothetical protein